MTDITPDAIAAGLAMIDTDALIDQVFSEAAAMNGAAVHADQKPGFVELTLAELYAIRERGDALNNLMTPARPGDPERLMGLIVCRVTAAGQTRVKALRET